jgi:hypothetical protein
VRLIALTLALLVIAVTGATAATKPRPALRISATAPLVVQGKAFQANEKVTLLLNVGKPLRAVVRTGSLGGFRYTFSYRLPRCTGVSIQAIGNRGSRASFSLDTPDCAPIQG